MKKISIIIILCLYSFASHAMREGFLFSILTIIHGAS